MCPAEGSAGQRVGGVANDIPFTIRISLPSYGGAMASFVTLKPAEAKAFLASFLDEAPQRLADLREQCSLQDGHAPHVLDLSPASVDPLWAWAKLRLSWRAGYQPLPQDLPVPKIPGEDIEPLGALPDWYNYGRGAWAF